MKRTLTKIALAFGLISLSLATTGCAGLAGLGTASNVTNPLKATTVDEKALIVAEQAFVAADDAILLGTRDGYIKGQTALTIKEYRTLAEAALEKAHEARRLGQSATIMEQAIVVQQLVAKIFGAIAKPKEPSQPIV
jgi:hypothetical protein